MLFFQIFPSELNIVKNVIWMDRFFVLLPSVDTIIYKHKVIIFCIVFIFIILLTVYNNICLFSANTYFHKYNFLEKDNAAIMERRKRIGSHCVDCGYIIR